MGEVTFVRLFCSVDHWRWPQRLFAGDPFWKHAGGNTLGLCLSFQFVSMAQQLVSLIMIVLWMFCLFVFGEYQFLFKFFDSASCPNLHRFLSCQQSSVLWSPFRYSEAKEGPLLRRRLAVCELHLLLQPPPAPKTAERHVRFEVKTKTRKRLPVLPRVQEKQTPWFKNIVCFLLFLFKKIKVILNNKKNYFTSSDPHRDIILKHICHKFRHSLC